MVVVLLLVLELALLAAWAKRGLLVDVDAEVEAYVRRVEEAARAGQPFAARRTLTTGLAATAVAGVLSAAEAAGRPLVASLAAFERELRRSRAHALECRRVWRLYYGRAALVFAIAAAARAWIAFGSRHQIQEPWGTPEDAVAISLAGLLIAAGHVWLLKALPVDWLGRRPLSSIALDWLGSHVLLQASPSEVASPWAQTLLAVRRRQLLHGVNLEGEMRRLLLDWARFQAVELRATLRKVEDVLPLIELTTIGIPAALILLVPLLGWV